MYDVANKYILITNFSIQDYAGAEINCLSLATLLTKMGANVEIATFNYAYPIREEYEKEEIKVTNILLEKLNRTVYDLIWGHHTVVLDYIIWELNITAPKIVYSSLSPFEALEAPPLYANELSLCLVNSPETKTQILMENVIPQKIQVFPNYVFYNMLEKQNNYLYGKFPERIAIVSNHLAPEISGLVEMLQARKISVDIFGKGYNQVMVTDSTLLQYDLIVTIGKTVQYAMALKIPVFCYDIHGGPGFLNNKNVEQAFYYNFSGRGEFCKHTSAELLEDILENYEYNLQFLEPNQAFIAKHCVLENNIIHVFENISEKNDVNLDSIKKNYQSLKRHNQAFVREYRYNLYRKMQLIDKDNEESRLNEILENLAVLNDQITDIVGRFC